MVGRHLQEVVNDKVSGLMAKGGGRGGESEPLATASGLSRDNFWGDFRQFRVFSSSYFCLSTSG